MKGPQAFRILGAINLLKKLGYTVSKIDDSGVDCLDKETKELKKIVKKFAKQYKKDLQESTKKWETAAEYIKDQIKNL